MLAGRKLLLADDSITIQKVVDLTFADEGVKVFCVGNGQEAVARLEEIAPDVVLADVFMPQMNGYEVCEHIKQNEKFKHIPVMLLVGSFEPFDEAEARRVGADEILTKPFQSIRKLIDKVGGLMGGAPQAAPPVQTPTPAHDATTAELPHTQRYTPEPEKLSTADLELSTADTQRLPDQLKSLAAQTAHASISKNVPRGVSTDNQTMDTPFSSSDKDTRSSAESADVLLDLDDDFEPIDDAIDEEFVLDVEFNEADEPAPSYGSSAGLAQPQASSSRAGESGSWTPIGPEAYESSSISDPRATTEEFARPGFVDSARSSFERVTDEPTDSSRQTGRQSGKITLDQLSPEVIDAIARRAVEMLSEKVVREIAWEVVPDLSELMIKKQLEEKKS